MSQKESILKYNLELPKLNSDELNEYNNIKNEIIQLKLNNNITITQKEIKKILKQHNIKNQENILQKITQELTGYKELTPLIEDDNLEEIMIIGNNKPVYIYHRTKGMMKTNLIFTKESQIRQIIDKIAQQVNRKIDQQTPILDARLKDGSRVNATIPPISSDGSTLTIRKFKKDPLTIIDLINNKTLTTHLAAFLWLSIEGLGINPINMIIAGGTGSGKTTTLNTLTTFIPSYERLITIEDTLEIQTAHKHTIRLETRPPNIEQKGEITMDMLLKNSLRQRPDKIIVGEVRSKEAMTLFTALNTGHSGMGTVHANTTKETISRLRNPPMNVPQIMITSLNYIIMQNRLYNAKQGTIRRITEVAEIVGSEQDQIQLNKIYQYNNKKDTLDYTAITCVALREIAKKKGITTKEIEDELKKRQKTLEYMQEKNIHQIDDVQEIIDQYYKNQ
ncbi:MAG: CpaF family protein [Methanobacteriaceae archaeon]|nr:CpaF family protein [Methanobacteriaceae archaeon]